MGKFGHLSIQEEKVPGYERVVHFKVDEVGLDAIIAIHDTTLGPACGGIRLIPYGTYGEALEDVLRLSKGMSYKSSLAGIGFGGGKSVVIANPSAKDSSLLQAFGECVNFLEGKYICAKDMNISSEDLLEVKKQTRFVLGIDGVMGSGGDPSPVTALGVFYAMEATLEFLNKSKSFKGIRVAIQGLGDVGIDLAKGIFDCGGDIYACEIDPVKMAKAKQALRLHEVSADQIYGVDCEIFSPCARGAVLNSRTIEKLQCKAIVGCANNQLETVSDGIRLFEKQILYTPDYLANAGGIINVFTEHEGYSRERALERTQTIYETTLEVLTLSQKRGVPPFKIADELAERRIRDAQ